MIFDKLADRVVKGYKGIIAIWVVILIVSVPMVFKVNDVLVYDETSAGGEKLTAESITAGEIVDREFPSAAANSSLIVVVQGDLSTPAVRDYILGAEQKAFSDSHITTLENFTSIYSVYRLVMEQSARELPPVLGGLEANLTSISFMTQYLAQWGGMNGTLLLVWGIPSMYAQARDGVNGTAMMLYGLPSMYAQAWDGVNGTAMMVWGIPSMYAQAWEGVNGSAFLVYGVPDLFQQAWSGTNLTAFMLYGIPFAFQQAYEGTNLTASLLYAGPAAYLQAWLGLAAIPDNSSRNLEAYNQSWQALNGSISDEGQRALLQGYQNAFYHRWDESFNASNASAYLPDTTAPDQRAQLTAEAVAPAYFDFATPQNQSQQAQSSVFHSFTIGNFTNSTHLSRYTNATTWQYLQSQMGGMPADPGQLALFQGYYDAFSSAWEASFQNSTIRDLASPARAEAVIDQMAAPYLAQALASDPAGLQMSMGVLGFFDLYDWANETLFSIYTNETVSSQLAAMGGGMGLLPEMQQMLTAYYASFYAGWNSSFGNTSLLGITPSERAASVVGQVAPGFIAQASATNASAGAMLQAVLAAFDNSSYSNQSRIGSVANQTFAVGLQAMAGSFGLPEEQLQGLFLYYDLFYQAWVGSYSNASLDGSSTSVRAAAAVDAALPSFIALTASNDTTARALLEGVGAGFNLTSWSDPLLVSSFANNTFYLNLQAMAGSLGLPAEMLQSLWLYYGLFYQCWTGSYANTSLEGLPTGARAQSSIDAAVPQFVAIAAANNTTMQAMLNGVHGAFGLGNWSNATLIDGFTNATFYGTMQSMAGSFGLPSGMTDGLFIYYSMFYEEWQASYSNATFEPATSMERVSYAVGRAVPRFAASGRMEGAFAAATYRHFDLARYSDMANLTANLNAAAQNETGGLMDAYLASGRLPADGAATVRANVAAFAEIWNRTFRPNDTLYLPPSIGLEARAAAAIDNATGAIFSSGSGSGGTNGASGLNMTALADPRNVRNLTIDMFLGGLGGRITVERAFLVEMYDRLGPHPSTAEVNGFVANVINSTTFGYYPIKLPGDITKSFVNSKNDTMIIALGFGTKTKQEIKDNIAALRSLLSEGRRQAGVRTYVTGNDAVGIEMEEQAFKDVEKIDPVTVIIVLVLVGLFFLSLLAPFFPFIGIGVALLASQSLLFLIGIFVAKIYYATNILLFVILMGTGMDYSIFILARYREERKGGRSKEESIHTSVQWAGESIATSGVAVMIGFGSMVIGDFAMIQTMGITLALAIGIGILAALTFTPSMLMVIGDRIFWPSRVKPGKEADAADDGNAEDKEVDSGRGSEEAGGTKAEGPAKEERPKKAKRDGEVFYFSSAVRLSLKHPYAVVGLCMLLFIPSLYLMFVMQPSFDFLEGMPKTEANEGIDAMAEGFGKGEIMPSQVVVQFKDPIYSGGDRYDTQALDAVDRLAARLLNTTVKDDKGDTIRIVRSATPSTYYLGERIDGVDWRVFGEATKNSTIAGAVGKSNRTVLIQLVFDREPMTRESLDTVPVLRQDIASYKKSDAKLSDATILVGGSSAGMYDIRKIIDDSMTNMRYFVVVGIFILLLVVLGSVLIPATAILSVGISIAWTIAATMAIFQYWGGIHVLWMVPLILFVVLMGLGMDYNIFLITRVREEVAKGRTHEEAIQHSVERTGGIITICGLIMAGAFGSMMLSSLGLLQQFGFALFFSIMLDAFVVRIYLMPAILKIAGKWSWWAPGRLQRVRIGPDGHGSEVRGRKAADDRPKAP